MKHIYRFVSIVSLVLTLFAVFTEVRPARAACLFASGSLANGTLLFIPVDPSHTYTVNDGSIFSPSTVSGTSLILISNFTGDPITYTVVDESIDCPPAANPVVFTDGRLNKFASETNQTAAIYCVAGNIEIYSTKGALLFRVTPAELARFKPTTRPQLVKQQNGIRIYLLNSGQLQLNAPPLEKGKPDYSFKFSPCS